MTAAGEPWGRHPQWNRRRGHAQRWPPGPVRIGDLLDTATGALELRGADSNDDDEHDDNVLRVAFGPSCRTCRLSANEWFGSGRQSTNC